MSRINLVLFDSLNNIKQEGTMLKPKTYEKLLKRLKLKFKNISSNYELFILDKNNKEIKITNEEEYTTITDKLFIREIDNSILEQSLYDINYNKLPESKQEVLDERYNCVLCINTIKNENPYFCYNCQKIFHERCLNNWDKECKSHNQLLKCPNCRNALPIEKWNKKLYYEEDRKLITDLIDKINDYESEINTIMNGKNKNNNIIDNKQIKYFDIIKNYELYIEQTIKCFKLILKKINLIHSLFKFKSNNKLSDLINNFPLNIKNLDLNDIINTINEEFDLIKNYIIANNNKIDLINRYPLLDKVDNKNRRMTQMNNNNALMIQNYIDDIDDNLQNDEYNKTINIV